MRPGVNGTVMAWRIARRLLDRGATGQHDQVGERDALAPLAEALNARWMASSFSGTRQRPCRLRVHGPVLLRREAQARTVGAAALVGTAERRGRGPGAATSAATDRPEARTFAFSVATSCAPTSG